MSRLALDGEMLDHVIRARFPNGRSGLLGAWDQSGEKLSNSTITRWLQGGMPKTGAELLKLGGILDVDCFALLTVADGSVEQYVHRALHSAREARWDRFAFLKEFFGRQPTWPPNGVPKFYGEAREWHHREFDHDAGEQANYYAVIQLTRAQAKPLPQVYHFAFKQQRRFANHWLDYGFVVHTHDEVRQFHINGERERYKLLGGETAYVETFLGPQSAHFRVSSLHAFSLAVVPDGTYSGPRVRFRG